MVANLLLSLRDGNFVDEWLLLASALAGFTPSPATQADYDKLEARLNNNPTQADFDKFEGMLNGNLQAIGTIIIYTYECGGAPPHLMEVAWEDRPGFGGGRNQTRPCTGYAKFFQRWQRKILRHSKRPLGGQRDLYVA